LSPKRPASVRTRNCDNATRSRMEGVSARDHRASVAVAANEHVLPESAQVVR
jgi:hypothetical protein